GGDGSYLVLTRNRTLLVSDARFTSQLQEECPGLEFHIRPTGQTIYQAAAQVLQKLGALSVGFESGYVTVSEWETLRVLAPAIAWKGIKDCVERLRVIKDPTEVAEIRQAVHFAERAFE